MKIETHKKCPNNIKSACEVVFASAKGKAVTGERKSIQKLKPFVDNEAFGKDFGSNLYFPSEETSSLYFNTGEKDVTSLLFRKAAAKALNFLKPKKTKKIFVDCSGLEPDSIRAILEGFVLADYQFKGYLKEPKKDSQIKAVSFNLTNTKVKLAQLERWQTICHGLYLARDLMLMPPNVLYPIILESQAKKLAKDGAFKVKVLDKSQIEKEKMGALLAVAQGSKQAPRFIIMDYHPEGAKKTFVLVGKAITFDSGGLSLKPGPSMPEMKGDMGGGATVFGVMSVLKKINCPYRVVGLVPSAENMPSGSAVRPSDVVISRSGLSIEVNNTDAEGRLILADALDYASKFKPDYVIDYATLTGACLVALGPKVCGIMGNCQKLVDAIVKTGYSLDDPFWQLPLEPDYEELLKSDVADVSNISSTRWGGAITAGLFLQRFAKDYQWAHCDIAAAILEKPHDFHPKGGSGAGIRTTIDVFDQMAAK